MAFTNSQKALAITLLISGTIILSVLNLTVFKMKTAIAETTYEIEKIEDIITDEAEALQPENNTKATNKAYNTSENYKHYAQAYKPIAPPEDYTNPKLETYKNSMESNAPSNKNEGSSAISEATLTDFNSVNEIINKRSENKSAKQSHVVNTNSSIYYSLKGRLDTFLPIPLYLCEAQGKIVVNILVDNNGNVTSAYINTASTSSNACLQDHALEYAKEAKFNASSKKEQLGSITFEFKGK